MISTGLFSILLMFLMLSIFFYLSELNIKKIIIKNKIQLKEEKSWRNILQLFPSGFLTFDIEKQEINFANEMAKKTLKIKKAKKGDVKKVFEDTILLTEFE